MDVPHEIGKRYININQAQNKVMIQTDSALWKIVENMPDSLKVELLHYAEYLMTKSSHFPPEETSKEKPKKQKLAGSMKGTFILP